MTRDEAVAIYQPIRAGIMPLTRLAMQDVSRLDLQRSAKQLDLWSDGQIVVPDDGPEMDMLLDVALFEANQRRVRPIDRFLEKRVPTLPEPQRALAERMARARFSLFHVRGKHNAGGLELTDLLYGNQDVWLMDLTIDKHVDAGFVIGMRVFDAGPFHVGFGIATMPDEDTIQMTVHLMESEGRTPFRYPLSATLYSDSIRARRGHTGDDQDVLDALTQIMSSIDPPKPQGKRKPKR